MKNKKSIPWMLKMAVLVCLAYYALLSGSYYYHVILMDDDKNHPSCTTTTGSATMTNDNNELLPPTNEATATFTTKVKESTTATSSSTAINYLNSTFLDMSELPYKIWKKPSSGMFPCPPSTEHDNNNWKELQSKPGTQGLLFVREKKVASSTLSGILLNIAMKRGNKQQQSLVSNDNTNDNTNSKICPIRINHGSARYYDYKKRDKSQSYLISLLRHPTSRAISHYFFFVVNHQNVAPIDENFLKFLQSDDISNTYIKDLSVHRSHVESDLKFQLELTRKKKMQGNYNNDNENENNNNENAENNFLFVNEILQEYDFIGITERFNESMIVLKYLLGLDWSDILYVSARITYDSKFVVDRKTTQCRYRIPTFVNPQIQYYLQSKHWLYYQQYYDLQLYYSISKSLDETIQNIIPGGKDGMIHELQIYENLLEKAYEICGKDRVIYKNQCNDEGVYIKDNSNGTCPIYGIGCWNECLNNHNINSVSI